MFKNKETLIVLMIFSFTHIVTAQCEDISPAAKRILSEKNVEAYELHVVGACIDETGVLHLTGKLDGLHSFVLRNLGFDGEHIAVIQTLEPFFTSVRKFFTAFPEVMHIRFYYVSFEKVRDKYGNFVEDRKNIKNILGISRVTASKINWEYIDENLKPIMGYGDYMELYRMLDEVYIKDRWVQR